MLSDIEIGHGGNDSRGGEARCGHHHGADASTTLIIGAGLRLQICVTYGEIRSSVACFSCLYLYRIIK